MGFIVFGFKFGFLVVIVKIIVFEVVLFCFKFFEYGVFMKNGDCLFRLIVIMVNVEI